MRFQAAVACKNIVALRDNGSCHQRQKGMILLHIGRLVGRHLQRKRFGFATGLLLFHHHLFLLHTTVLLLCMQGDCYVRQVAAAIEVVDIYPEAGNPEYNGQ